MPQVHNHGFLEPARCEQLLRNCHLAYLPVSLNTRFGPYSVPSRLADYLACGLPTITCTSAGTGIFSFIQAAPAGAAVNVTNTDDLVNAMTELAANPARWQRASTDAASYAKQVLHADRVRAQLLEYDAVLAFGKPIDHRVISGDGRLSVPALFMSMFGEATPGH